MNYIETNDLGTYASIEALWAAHPEGGHEGDYCTIGTTKYRWDKYDRMWIADPNFGPTQAREMKTFDGDVTIQNNLTVAGTIRAAAVKQPCVGLFATAAALEAAYPSPEVGMWAVVGDTMPGPIYRCSVAGSWSATGEDGGVDDIDLTDYAKEEDLEALEERVDDHEDRIDVLEDIVSDSVTYTPAVAHGKAILRDPSTSRGDIAVVSSMDLHVYTGLAAGDEITIKFTGTDTTSTAQAAGWYTTADVESMSKSTFTAVDGLSNYTKNVVGNTYSVVVPTGVTALVLCVLSGHVTTEVSSPNRIGGKINNLDSRVTALEETSERIDDLEDSLEEVENAIHIEENDPLGEDEYVDGYRIANSDADLTDDASSLHVFALKSYQVTAGEKLRIVNTSNAQSSPTRVYAFYSNESLTDGGGNVLPTSSSNIAIDSSYNHTWASAIFDDTLVVPAGAKLLVITQVTSLASNPAVYQVETRDLSSVVEECLDVVSELDPYKMEVSRNGENIYVAYNRGNGTELVYWFGRVFPSTNNTLGLRYVGYRSVNRTNPEAAWDANEITALCNQVGSDMIGPIGIDNIFVGGAHDVGGVASATNVSWNVTADGEPVTSGAVVGCVRVIVTAVNKISHPTWGDICEETIVMAVCGDSLDVEVKHDYKYSGAVGKNINTYYGMQSYGFGTLNENLAQTIAGRYVTFTSQNTLTTFKKEDYPKFCEIIMRLPNGWHQMLRLDTTSYGTSDGVAYIGDHSWLNDDAVIFVRGTNDSKLYHVLVRGKAITSGMAYRWRGTYKWWK